MSGIVDDLIAEHEMTGEALAKLAALDPSHELLWFQRLPEGAPKDVPEHDEAIKNEMRDRFWDKKRGRWQEADPPYRGCVVSSNYRAMIEAEIRKIEGHGGQIALAPGGW